jgi:hypothetical protein
MIKRKMTRTKLEIFCQDTFLPVYNQAQKWGPVPLWIRLCIILSLRGWPFDSERDLEVFFRNIYSGQVMSKNKINILSRTKRNTA